MNAVAEREHLACLELPALPLQLLLERCPELRETPAVIVDVDTPNGRILWVNDAAWAHRIRPGMRYAAALSLNAQLRADVLEPAQLERGARRLTEHLRRFSPRVEPSTEIPGLFFIDASGLERLFGSLMEWGERLLASLLELGFDARLCVGFTRFGTFAATRLLPRLSSPLLLTDPQDEHRRLLSTPLERLGLEPRLCETLHRLGLRHVEAFLALPVDGLQTRFGPAAVELHRRAALQTFEPLRPQPIPPNLWRRLLCEHGETDTTRLLFLVKRLVDQLLTLLAERHEALTELHLQLRLNTRVNAPEEERHTLRPGEPTLDSPVLLDLLRLRMDQLELRAGVVELRVGVVGVRATAEQLRLFRDGPKRDLMAANRALARVRAELGEGAVQRAELREGHLPEARFGFAPLSELRAPEAKTRPPRVLQRRLLAKPLRLKPVPRHLRDDGWVPHDPAAGAVVKLHGPYAISGGWWSQEQSREYHFAETKRGDLLWVYYDRKRRNWYLHGWVE
ncbi:MAG: DNA polymerase Y family protein [Myxococcales bacterium]|nr:DNA polymerase Y family protein [Myxococcales bacterium]